jgi:hypothetical protein
VQRLDGLSRLFLIAVVAYVTGRWFDRTLVPLSGPVAVLALAGLVWARPLPRAAPPWTKVPLVAGLALLAVALARPDGDGLFTDGLTAAACAGIGTGVLGRAGRLVRWGILPAAGFAALVIVAGVGIAWHPEVAEWEPQPNLYARTAIAIALATVLAVVGFAVNAALISRRAIRWAGAGLLPVLVLAWPLMPSVLAEPRSRAVYVTIVVATPEMEERALAGTTNVDPDQESRSEGLSGELVTVAPPEPVSQIRTDPAAALGSALLLIGLAAIATTLFPYRE